METFFHILPEGRINERFRIRQPEEARAAAKLEAQRSGRPVFIMGMVGVMWPEAADVTKTRVRFIPARAAPGAAE